MIDNTTTHCIYILVDETLTPFYVGKTVNPKRRLTRHLQEVRKGNHYPVYNKLRQVLARTGWKRDGLLQVIEKDVPDAIVDDREEFYIAEYKKRGLRLKNLTSGGEGGKGFTREIIERGASKRRGRHRSEECKRRMSEAKRGIPLTESHKRALKKAWKTRDSLPPEHYQRISAMNRGVVNIKNFVVMSPDGELFTTIQGLTEFCRENGLDARNLIHTKPNGSRKHHRGWKIMREIEVSA